MGLYRRADSPRWWYSITIDGHRFRGPCGTESKEEAKLVIAEKRIQHRAEARSGTISEITLNDAFVRYWQEHAGRLRSEKDIARTGEVLISGLGKNTTLSALTGDEISAYVAKRRRHLSDASVNRELTILRAVMRMAALRWGKAVASIEWKRQFLIEPAPRDRTLSPEEEDRLFAALRSDFHGLVRFALAAGLRLDNARTLRWSQVSWDEGLIRIRLKSKRPGGDVHAIPISRRIAAILSAEKGRHETFVFTYIQQRARSADTREHERIVGERRPFTKSGWRRMWMKALKEAEISDFRFHDLRHTHATRLLRATGNLALVKRMLGHRSIATTMRYAHSDAEDLKAGLERLEDAGVTKSVTPRRKVLK